MKTLILLLLVIMCMSCEPMKPPQSYQYTVKLTYCDNRKPDTITVTEYSEPGKWEINNYKRAVPEWRNYLNVCDLKVIARTDSLLIK
jgi:hypothetical protein